METYDIPLVPGPVRVPAAVRAAYQTDYGSADLEPEYLTLYAETQRRLGQIMGTANSFAIMTGEGMLALWSALKSCLKPGDRVVAVATGLFGEGIGDMARAIGAEVETVSFGFDEAATDLARIEAAIRRLRPKMITAVHCETPSGVLNPVAEIGRLKAERGVPLFYVDAVASIGGAPVLVDEWQIDLCLGGGQKALSALPDMSFLSVSEAAWAAIDAVDYPGYDALKPFRTALERAYFPYTPHWHGLAALHTAAGLLLEEGLEAVFARHAESAALCRQSLREMGLSLYPRDEAYAAPTVTAVTVPAWTTWAALDAALRQRGMAVGGNYGPLAGRVFRIGHMGSQADPALVQRGMAVLAESLPALRSRAQA